MAMLRSPVTSALNGVAGAVNGAAIATPLRVVQIQLAVGELGPELRHRLDPQRKIVMESIKAVAAGHCGRIQLDNRALMQWHGGRFKVEKTGVKAT
jgi:hypothetical protein